MERLTSYCFPDSGTNRIYPFPTLKVVHVKTEISFCPNVPAMLSNKSTLIPAFFNLFSSFSPPSVVVPVSATLPSDAAAPVLDSFVSLAIEFVAFPDFAGQFVLLLFCYFSSIRKGLEIFLKKEKHWRKSF